MLMHQVNIFKRKSAENGKFLWPFESKMLLSSSTKAFRQDLQEETSKVNSNKLVVLEPLFFPKSTQNPANVMETNNKTAGDRVLPWSKRPSAEKSVKKTKRRMTWSCDDFLNETQKLSQPPIDFTVSMGSFPVPEINAVRVTLSENGRSNVKMGVKKAVLHGRFAVSCQEFREKTIYQRPIKAQIPNKLPELTSAPSIPSDFKELKMHKKFPTFIPESTFVNQNKLPITSNVLNSRLLKEKTEIPLPPVVASHSCGRRECTCVFDRRPSLPREVSDNARRASIVNLKKQKTIVKEKTIIDELPSKPIIRFSKVVTVSSDNVSNSPDLLSRSSSSQSSHSLYKEDEEEDEEVEEEVSFTPIMETEFECDRCSNVYSSLRREAQTPNPFKGVHLARIKDESEMKYLELFKKLDLDSDGHIHYSQVKPVLRDQLTSGEERFLKLIYDLTSASTFFGAEEFVLLCKLCDKIASLEGPLRDAFDTVVDLDMHEIVEDLLDQFQSQALPPNSVEITDDDLKSIVSSVIGIDLDQGTQKEIQIQEHLQLESQKLIHKLDFLIFIPYFISLQPSLHRQFIAQRAKTLLLS